MGFILMCIGIAIFLLPVIILLNISRVSDDEEEEKIGWNKAYKIYSDKYDKEHKIRFENYYKRMEIIKEKLALLKENNRELFSKYYWEFHWKKKNDRYSDRDCKEEIYLNEYDEFIKELDKVIKDSTS